MKKIFIFTLLIFTAFVQAKDLSDYFRMMPRQNDLLYFIKPIELSNAERGKEYAEFDITYITSLDSATVNMSIYTPSMLETDSIVLHGANIYESIPKFEIFFVEPEKKLGWVHRYSCLIPFITLQKLYTSETPWELRIYSKGSKLTFQQTMREWEDEADRMNKIINVIRVNKLNYEEKNKAAK